MWWFVILRDVFSWGPKRTPLSFFTSSKVGCVYPTESVNWLGVAFLILYSMIPVYVATLVLGTLPALPASKLYKNNLRFRLPIIRTRANVAYWKYGKEAGTGKPAGLQTPMREQRLPAPPWYAAHLSCTLDVQKEMLKASFLETVVSNSPHSTLGVLITRDKNYSLKVRSSLCKRTAV